MRWLLILLLLLIFSIFSSGAQGTGLPLDADGWTVFTPSDDSKIIYIASDGDNTTCVAYDDDDEVIGPDPFDPVGPIVPCETYAVAFAKTRANFPDWILFKRGETFVQDIGSSIRNGRGLTEPFLLGAYGSSGLSPVIETGASSGHTAIQKCCSNTQFWAVFGLSFYAPARDPDSPSYVNEDNDSNGVSIFVGGASTGGGILIEGCRFRFFSNNTIQADTGGILTGVTVRRSVFLDNYRDGQHAQGLYLYNISAEIEENVFDHNGWYTAAPGTPGTATVYNHNLYTASMYDSVFSGNISSRPSSIHHKFSENNEGLSSHDVTVENNLYVYGKVGLSIGGNVFDDLRFVNFVLKNNVITELGGSDSTGQDIAWGIDVFDWDGGEITGNLMLKNSDPIITDASFITLNGVSRDVNILNNIVYGVVYSNGLEIKETSVTDNTQFADNILYTENNAGYLIQSDRSPAGIEFSWNKYYSNRAENSLFQLSGVGVSFETWQATTGDTSVHGPTGFFDVTRSIETYMDSIGQSATITDFINMARAQDRFSWDQEIMAGPVNDWIREGYFGPQRYGNLRTSGALRSIPGNGRIRD